MFRKRERRSQDTDDIFLCEQTGEHVCGRCEDEPDHNALHANAEGRDQFLRHGQCEACETQDVPITYRLGLDLFLCLPCHAQPNLGAILADKLIENLKERPD